MSRSSSKIQAKLRNPALGTNSTTYNAKMTISETCTGEERDLINEIIVSCQSLINQRWIKRECKVCKNRGKLTHTVFKTFKWKVNGALSWMNRLLRIV